MIIASIANALREFSIGMLVGAIVCAGMAIGAVVGVFAWRLGAILVPRPGVAPTVAALVVIAGLFGAYLVVR